MIIDHIGIVVKSIEKGIEHWEKVFEYKKMTNVVINSRQKVRVVFLSKENSLTVKLIEPTDESSPTYKFARKGGGLHHICFKCEDMNKELKRFSEKGLRVLAAPQPGEAFGNENIAFVYAKQGLNIELIETDIKAGRLF
ncbi:4-hydroxymandelate synthase [bacterium BMS3Abin06]|nr:4-hydroxymandelate synthase [bacterium BMS3Abin06]HDZ01894.1 methylmalonyl-CoA epimerase [Nitrospirota bacterium]